jgi:hypothetical protein
MTPPGASVLQAVSRLRRRTRRTDPGRRSEEGEVICDSTGVVG